MSLVKLLVVVFQLGIVGLKGARNAGSEWLGLKYHCATPDFVSSCMVSKC